MCACTTPEEDAQIKLFWLEQLMQFMPKQTRPVPALQPLPVMQQEQGLPPAPEQPRAPQNEALQAAATQQAVIHPVPKKTIQPAQRQFMEITLEDNTRRVNSLKSNAPLKERQAMQRAIERVKQSNQQALQDIGLMFDGDTQAQAFAIVAKSEKILMRTANTSNTYQNYLNAQRKILQEQDAQLNQLMRQNAYKLRRVRG